MLGEPDVVALICRSWKHGKNKFLSTLRAPLKTRNYFRSRPPPPGSHGNALPVRCAPRARINRWWNANKSELFNRQNDLRQGNTRTVSRFESSLILFFFKRSSYINIVVSLVDWFIWSVVTWLHGCARPFSRNSLNRKPYTIYTYIIYVHIRIYVIYTHTFHAHSTANEWVYYIFFFFNNIRFLSP